MIVWFATIAVLGALQIAAHPVVLEALSPTTPPASSSDNGSEGFLVLGSVFLVLTGAEALYADMGHFGRGPIRLGWFAVVLPALLLTTSGRAPSCSTTRRRSTNPFFNLVPGWGVIPLVVLATAATVIASQALITGVFSLTVQAVQLGYLPRIRVSHTSDRGHRAGLRARS